MQQGMLHEKLGVNRTDLPSVGGPLFAYLFHGINQRTLKQEFQDQRQVALRLVELTKHDGHLLRNCKLYAWAYHKYRCGAMQQRPRALHYKVKLVDAAFLRKINLHHLPLRYESYSLEDFTQIVEDTVDSAHMRQHIGKLISKKMIFLIRSYGADRENIEGDLRANAIRALYMQYPRFESLLHLTNVAKTTIHNTAMTMIKQSTNGVRNRLYVDENGDFQAVHQDLGQSLINKIAAPDPYMAHIRDHLETMSKVGERMKPKLQRFMLCCAGHYDREFSEFLECDNSEAADRMDYEKYLKKAKQFFEFTDDQIDRVFSRMKTYLAP